MCSHNVRTVQAMLLTQMFVLMPKMSPLYTNISYQEIISFAIAQVVTYQFPPWWPRFDPRSGHEGFLVDHMALGQDFSESFSSPENCSIFINHAIIQCHNASIKTVSLNDQLKKKRERTETELLKPRMVHNRY